MACHDHPPSVENLAPSVLNVAFGQFRRDDTMESGYDEFRSRIAHSAPVTAFTSDACTSPPHRVPSSGWASATREFRSAK